MSLSLKDTYKDYEESVKNPITFKEYIDLTSGFMRFIMHKVFEGFCITLPAKLGTLEVIGKKQKVKIVDGEIKGLAPDWVKTKELWEKNPEAKKQKKLIYHTNHQTNGYRYKFFWSKKRVLVEFKSLYTLKFTRSNKRTLSKMIFDGKPFKTIS